MELREIQIEHCIFRILRGRNLVMDKSIEVSIRKKVKFKTRRN